MKITKIMLSAVALALLAGVLIVPVAEANTVEARGAAGLCRVLGYRHRVFDPFYARVYPKLLHHLPRGLF